MNNDLSLPLLSAFLRLQQRGFALGLPDYLLVLQALVCGFGIGSREELVFTCRTIWGKTPEEQDQVEDAVRWELPPELTQVRIQELIATITADLNNEQGGTAGTQEPAIPPSLEQRSGNDGTPCEDKVPGKGEAKEAIEPNLFFNLKQGPGEFDIQIDPPEIPALLKRDFDFQIHLPVSPRRMEQTLRRYRQMLRSGISGELDCDATIQEIHRCGVLVKPVFHFRRTNKARLLILRDEGGSMAPFKPVIDALIRIAMKADFQARAVYYFRNVPRELLFQDSDLLQAQTLQEVLSAYQSAGVLIVSDAGAARGSYNSDRIEKTKRLIASLRRNHFSIAWLNPMPKDRWKQTSAEDIKLRCQVPMFPLDRAGLLAAIDVIRGRTE